MICSVEDCGGPAYRRGLCNKHRLRQSRYGRLDLVHPSKSPLGNHCGGECRGAKKLRTYLDYALDPETFKSRAAQWCVDNNDRYRQRLRNYLDKPATQVAARKRTIAWTRSNPERKKAADRAFAEANRALVTSYRAARRARVLQATPPWLTPEHWEQIRSVYTEARKLSVETGIPHDVDHIVPLRGKTVCGLHVPWNLRAIPKVQNNRRPRVWTGTTD